MRVLIIGINYAPEQTGIAPYTAGLAEHLAGRGLSVTAVTGLPSYPEWRVHAGYQGLLWRRHERRGVEVQRRWHWVPRRQTALHRGLYEASFLLTGLSALAVERPDAIIGIVPSLGGGLLARLAALRFGVPYGLILQDLVGQAAGQSGLSGGADVAPLVRVGEGWAARGAAAVAIVAEGFRPYVESLGVEPPKVRRLRNWTVLREPTHDRWAVRERLGLSQDSTVCLHAGNMGAKQGLETVVRCASMAAERDAKLSFVLMGDGSQRGSLEAMAAVSGLPNLRFLPQQPEGLFAAALGAADILLLSQRPSVSDMSLPSKLTSYFAAGRPVVASVAPQSEAASEVRASGAGLVVPAGDPAVLLHAIETLARDEGRRARLGAAGRAWARDALSQTAVMGGYEDFLSDVVRAGGSRQACREVEEAFRRSRGDDPAAAGAQKDADGRLQAEGEGSHAEDTVLVR